MSDLQLLELYQNWLKYVSLHFLCVGPVSIVSIASPYRKGKSYILSKAFDQPEVFPLGHHFDPETVGIWTWMVPQKMRVSSHEPGK